MVKSFKHKGLQKFFETGSVAGIQPRHANRLLIQLIALNYAQTLSDMGNPGWSLHPLKGNLVGHWAITVSGNWRLTFMFDGADVILVDYQDYH